MAFINKNNDGAIYLVPRHLQGEQKCAQLRAQARLAPSHDPGSEQVAYAGKQLGGRTHDRAKLL